MEEIWNQVKSAIKERIPSHSYRMWIEPLALNQCNEGRAVLSCPNFFSKKRVKDHYVSLIESQINEFTGKACKLSLEIAEKKNEMERPVVHERQLPLPNINIQPSCGRLLRKTFTFDRFVVGGNNDFAFNASLSLASGTILNQNSLFLLSNTGMGKSHLSQAIGHHILNQHPEESVYYITAEDFTNEMVNAFRHDSIDSFKEKYRNKCDVLILEDIHFLTGKDRTQVELALSLDYLFDSNKKIIFTSCYLPSDIPKMNEQLRSRLSCGLIPSIEPPDFRMRVKILQTKAKEHGYIIPGEITEYLASELTDNVRQLESGLIGVTAKSSLMKKNMDLRLAKSVVKNIVQLKKSITIDVIKQLVCNHYKISVEEIISKSRKHSIVRPRQMAMYLSRKHTDHTLQVIGKSFNRYHATAIRSVGAVERGIKEDNMIRKQVSFFDEQLKTGKFK